MHVNPTADIREVWILLLQLLNQPATREKTELYQIHQYTMACMDGTRINESLAAGELHYSQQSDASTMFHL